MTDHLKTAPGWCVLLMAYLMPLLLHAQPGASVQLEKPKKYEKRILASEKPTDKPLNPVKKAGQNLNTRYNFYFNTERKLNEILLNARTGFKDNFGKLLPFYNFSFEATASQERDLDSILWRCNDGILLHDLRNDWVDDLYLMMGKAYYYKKRFDSAAIAFQYVNYAFQPRKKDEIGYTKYIGSNANEGGSTTNISTREKNDPVSRTLLHTPARNESLVWLTKSLIEKEQFGEAWSLIETLRKDPDFPKRLDPDLNELQAYLHYRQENWDSAAYFLEASLENAGSIQEKARWEYLLAQMHELRKDPREADLWYDKSINHTTDPVMEAYARINRIRLVTGEDENKRIQMNIDELMRMVKKDKYEDYKHIIYYAAAKMEIMRGGFDKAVDYLKLSGINSGNDPSFRTIAYLDMADLAYNNRMYRIAAMGYDSIDINAPEVTEPDMIQDRKLVLSEILRHQETIRVEDSLLRIAAMPEQERLTYVKGLVRKLRREKGLKEEQAADAGFMGGTSSVVDPTRQDQPSDLFASNAGKGDWYFYNTSMRSKGTREFKATWGNRPNVDNWRRAKAISDQMAQMQQQPVPKTDLPAISASGAANSKTIAAELTTEALMQNIPLSPEMVQVSNDSIAAALNQLGKIFREKTGDCPSLIRNNEELLNRYPQSVYTEEALFGLYYCHMKAGNTDKAKFYKDYMSRTYSQSKYLRMINDPKKADEESRALQTAATRKYEDIYNSFIEGDFNKALAEKKKADSSYGETYWTPQLLYIESIYHIRQRDDSTAIATLSKLMALYPQSPMTEKAATMINVLQRRSEIENYLANLQVERAKEESYSVDIGTEKTNTRKAPEAVVAQKKVEVKDPGLVAPELPRNKETVGKNAVKAGDVKTADKPLKVAIDTTKFVRPVMENKLFGYEFIPSQQHLVVLLLEKVDPVYVNEARNALNRYNRDKYSGKTFELAASNLDETRKMITIAAFDGVVEANDYMKRASSSAASEIFPWMPREKVSFMVITAANLEVLKERKDVKQYLELLQLNIPLK